MVLALVHDAAGSASSGMVFPPCEFYMRQTSTNVTSKESYFHLSEATLHILHLESPLCLDARCSPPQMNLNKCHLKKENSLTSPTSEAFASRAWGSQDVRHKASHRGWQPEPGKAGSFVLPGSASFWHVRTWCMSQHRKAGPLLTQFMLFCPSAD